MLKDIINLLYPPLCHICNKKTSLWNESLCPDCLKNIKKRVPPFCIICGKKISCAPEIKTLCIDCKRQRPSFDRAGSVFYYIDPLKQVVHNFKYKRLDIPDYLIESTIEFMKEYGIGNNTDIVLPIPMHPLRLLQREVNPSDVLAKKIAKKLGIPYSNRILKKIKNTPPQSRLKRKERMVNVKGSFSIRKNSFCDNRYKNILLVDDLFTTGTTVNECAKILKEKGSNYIEAITLARGDKPL